MLPLSLLLIHFLKFGSICNGYTIETEFEYQYYNKSITCIDGVDCEIKCQHNYGCKYSQITCPDGFNCSMYFSAIESGYNANVFAQNSNNIIISATGSSSARYTDFHAPKQETQIICGNSYACEHAKIYGLNSSQIITDCNGYRSCRYMQLFTDDVNFMGLSCTGSYSCQYIKLYQQSPLPPSQFNMECAATSCQYATIKSNAETLQVNCGGCDYANIYYNPYSNDTNASVICAAGGCFETDIYAIEGIFDIGVIGNVAQSNLRLHCGINYYYSCELQPSIDSNNMLCDDTDICMNYQYNPAKHYDVIIPQSYDRYNDTIECDSDLQDCSIYCIGKYSCAYTDIMCPQNKENATCTVYCGSYGCSHSTIIANNISSLIVYTKSNYGLEYVSTEVTSLKNVIFNCVNGYGCQYMKLIAVNTDQIDIQCHGSYSCQYCNILYVSDGGYVAGYTVPADVDLDCYGYYSCRNSIVNSNAGYLNVECNSDTSSTDACYDLSLYCPVSSILVDENDTNPYCDVLCGKTDSCINLDVYSINGWNNVRVSSINDQYPSSTTMYCNPAFSQFCKMQGHVNSNEWFCDNAEICSNYRWNVNTTLVITTESYEYYNKTIECQPDEDCYIFCGKSYSCMYATIQCANANCNLYCYGTESCKYSLIMGSSTNTLNIYSTASNAISYSKIHSSHNDLYMKCSSTYSCQYQTIYASNTEQISMDCLSSYSCQYQTIHAENNNNFYQNCAASYSCRNSAFYQYSSPQTHADHVNINCHGTYSCHQSSIRTSLPWNLLCQNDHSCSELNAFIPQHESFHLLCINDQSCNSIDIMSLNGFINSNINITSFDDSYANTARFFCGYGYTKFCALNGLINSNQWICTDPTNYCYDYELEEENTDYIVLNYNYQYAYNYINCDQNKTNCDIKCKASYGCWNSKIICPATENATCSVYCTSSYSCRNLDIYALNGYLELSLDCNSNNAYCSGITVFCTPYFNESCTIDSNGDCIGFCNNYTNNYSDFASIDLNFGINYFSPNNSYIVATHQYQYYNNSILCNGSGHNQCIIKCSNSHSCQHSLITFVGNDLDCYLQCTSSYACASAIIHAETCLSLKVIANDLGLESATIYPSYNQTLSIDCLSMYSCRYLKLYGDVIASSLQIYQSCNGYMSCQYQYWSIHSAHSVIVDCFGSYSCRSSQYYIYSLLSLQWNCKGDDSCYGATIKTDANQVVINCDADDACYGSKLFVPEYSVINCSHSGGCENTAIYSILGSKSLNIVSTINNSLATSNKLYCTESYVKSCILQNNDVTEWNCDLNNFCYEYLPNNDHIQTIYKYQFYNDDIICNNNKDCFISCKHQYSCQHSSIQCPDDHSCDIYCGYYGCSQSTVTVGNNGNLSLICYDDYSCSKSKIYGMQTSNSVSIQCLDSYSCQYMQMFAEYVNDLTVDCIGYSSCKYGKIYQHSTETIRTYFNCQGQYSCASILLSTNAVQALFICNKDQESDYGCNSINIYYGGQTENGLNILCDNINSCKNNNYYVSNGEYSVNITTFAVTYAETNKLHCCHSWIGSCTLKGQIFSDELICSDITSICASNGCSFMDSSNIISINQKYKYFNKSIECDDNNMDCNIICTAQYSCSYSTIYCPSGYDCNLYCTNQYSCDHSLIQAKDSKSLMVQASGSYSLQSAIIYAPINQNKLDISCTGSYSCQNVKLNAPYSYINSLQCSSSYSCNNMRISSEYALYFDWSCIGSYSCRDSMIWHHETTATYFGLNCNGYYACDDIYAIVSAQNVNINCGDGTYTCADTFIFCKSEANCTIQCKSQQGCNSMDIYAVEQYNVNTLHVLRGDVEFEPNIILHCGLLYEHKCELKANNISNYLLCDETNICSNYQLNYETTDYIVFKWAYMNYKQNITCNNNKTNCKIYCSGSYSCQYNTIQCASNSNSFCKIYAGSSGCQNSKIYAQEIDSFEITTAGTSAFASSQFYIESKLFTHDARSSYGLSSSVINVASDAIDLDCSYDYGCQSINVILDTNDTALTLYCPSRYSCRYAKLNAGNRNLDATIDCIGYHSCRSMNVYAANANKLHINCQGSYGCLSAKLYTSNVITYDSLDCISSTSCQALTTYCSYPSLDQSCIMQYESDPALWFCQGDICFYDNDCEDYNGLQLYPNSGSILGGDTIIISGPCYNPNVNYTCTFGTKQTELNIINATHGYCISMSSSEKGNVLFTVHEDNEWYGMISTFYYNDLYDDSGIIMDPPIELLYNDTMINISWSVSDLNSNFVNISMYQLIPYLHHKREMLLQSHFLAHLESNIENNGTQKIYLNNTDISSLNISTNWDIIYGNLSEISNIIIVAVESFDIVNSIPIMRRKASKFIIQLYPQNNVTNLTSETRRRIISFGTIGKAVGRGLAKAFAVAWVGCKAWKFLDEQVHGEWWKDRGLERCPDRDPSDRITNPQCEGPWQPDDACQGGGIGCDIFHTGAHNCIRSGRGQQCCYKKDRNLCTESPCGGTADLAPAGQGVVSHFIVDVFPYLLCRPSGNINDYYDRRPSDPGSRDGGRAAEACAPVGGDPHFVTFDLFNYTFNGIGDYYYLYHDDFKILIRMKQFNNGSIITKFGLDIDTNSSFSFNRSNSAIIDTLEISIDDQNNKLDVYMNGEIMLYTPNMYGINIVIGDISINYNEDNIIIRCGFGVFAEVWLRNIDNTLQFIEYTVDVDAKYQNTVSGLIGNYDNDESNDLQSRNGTILLDSSTIERIHYDFGLSWLLNDDDNNIFHNSFVSPINSLNYKPLFGFEDVDTNLFQMATDKCGNEFSCLYDVIATEVVEIANTTLKFVDFAKETAATIKTLYNVTEIKTPSPTFEGCAVSESMNLYLLVDTNCNMTISQCVDQQLFISTLLQKIKSNDQNIEQLFGYIEYGNGANKVFTLNDALNDDFSLLLETVREITDCNNLYGSINNPYYAIQAAIDDFTNINNDYNNIILIISGCPPSSETDHSCSLKETFNDENIKLFVINNNNNNNSYECLVNNANDQIVNLNDYTMQNMNNVINNICSWIGITKNPTNEPTEPPTNVVKEITNSNSIKMPSWEYAMIILGSIIFICLLCILCHWCYIHKLKKSYAKKIKYGSIEMNENNENKLPNKYTSIQSEYSATASMQTTNPQTLKVIGDTEMEAITENVDTNDYH